MMTLKILLGLYLLLCGVLYVFQERLIFLPQKLENTYRFNFEGRYVDQYFKLPDGTVLHGLLFKAKKSKGLVFYLHGNAGSLAGWGTVAKTYTDLDYDVFILDYRAYGKSEGRITGEQMLFEDVAIVYDSLKENYPEEKIVVLGYSIGTGLAAKLASTNHSKLLILQAPYYNLTDVMQKTFFIIPPFVLRYKLETNVYLSKCKMPVVIFHGDANRVIYYGSSLKLKAEFKQSDRLITLPGQGHNGITDHPLYLHEIRNLLQ